ncbi:MAG TPA: copper-binding protein [Candidatus Udaeobacter sp.]|jgi:Cu/Ag efflux protein CusF|nr:copper-binding protein [Candidatus Udaeobacter sp.]
MKTQQTLRKALGGVTAALVMALGLTQASPGLNLNFAERTATQLIQGLFAPAPAIAQSLVEGKGKVIAVTQEKQELVLEHEAIKGFMDAMTMGYKVNSPSLLKGLKPGDQVRFTIDKDKSVITKITKVKN